MKPSLTESEKQAADQITRKILIWILPAIFLCTLCITAGIYLAVEKVLETPCINIPVADHYYNT